MKKPILGFVAAISMLAAPAVHGISRTGSTDTPKSSWTFKELLQPDRFYTEHIQSKDQRPDKELVDECFKQKELMKIKRFVILKKTDLSKAEHLDYSDTKNSDMITYTRGHSQNFILASIIQLDASTLDKDIAEGKTWKNTLTLLHELTHVKEGHDQKNVKNMMWYTALSATGTIIAKRNPAVGNALYRIGILGNLSIAYKTISKQPPTQKDLQQWEFEAEQGVRKAAAACGYCETLEEALRDTRQKMQYQNPDYRLLSIYPNLKELDAMESKALAQCRAHTNIDHHTTKNSRMLMRNEPIRPQSTPQPKAHNTWYETLFGKRSV